MFDVRRIDGMSARRHAGTPARRYTETLHSTSARPPPIFSPFCASPSPSFRLSFAPVSVFLRLAPLHISLSLALSLSLSLSLSPSELDPIYLATANVRVRIRRRERDRGPRGPGGACLDCDSWAVFCGGRGGRAGEGWWWWWGCCVVGQAGEPQERAQGHHQPRVVPGAQLGGPPRPRHQGPRAGECRP